jgi:cell wall-associated NlpC family hydrolase
MKKNLTISYAFLALFLISVSTAAVEVPITTFPLKKYDQNVDHWIKRSDPDYNKPLIKFSIQKKHLKEYYNRYYATDAKALSPWSRKHVIKMLNKGLKDEIPQQKIIGKYANPNETDPEKIGYAENFRTYSPLWINNIITNINLKQFKFPIKYNPGNRGIAVKNLHVRILPTTDPYYYNFSLPGNGYPFDNLQESSLWVGTPVYVIGETLDSQWCLVLTPHYYIGWVESDGIAKTSPTFIATWQKYAKQKMVAITRTNLSIFDKNKQFRFSTHIGAVFPGKNNTKNTINILIPIASSYHNAKITFAKLKSKDATVMPLKATPHNFATIISGLIGRPYGWGNMYFYNDCSAELQNLYTPFGIWLPRNSGAQIKIGKMVDKSSENMGERLKYLMKNGKKFTTIIYIGGHVMLYIGNHPNPNSDTHEPMIMTYQNMWGLRPEDNSRRAVVGQAVLFPILTDYPEDSELESFANKKYFQITYLD